LQGKGFAIHDDSLHVTDSGRGYVGQVSDDYFITRSYGISVPAELAQNSWRPAAGDRPILGAAWRRHFHTYDNMWKAKIEASRDARYWTGDLCLPLDRAAVVCIRE
jgi:hypothetical protein